MSQIPPRNGAIPFVEREVPLGMFESDDKISYTEYFRDVRPPIELLRLSNNQQNEDCECD